MGPGAGSMGPVGGGGGAGGVGMGGSLMGSGPMRGPSAGSLAGSNASGAGGAGGPRPLASSDTIIVRCLPENCTWQGLREGFSHCGEIKYAEMKERGTGLVRFTSERDAERAMSVMDKHQIGSRAIEVRLY